MKGLWAIITFFGLMTTALGGYPYDVKALRKWEPEFNRYHYWIGFSDFHDKVHPANSIQRKKIEEHLPKYDPRDILVLVEDLSSPNSDGRLGCGAFYINSRTGILAGLGNFCKNNKVPVCNVEYRYCRVVALGPVINNIYADPSLFPSTQKMTVTHLMQEIEQTYNDLLLGSYNPLFKTALEEKSVQMQKEIKKFNLMRDHKKSIADYLAANSTPANRLDMVKNLLTFDGILIGFKLVDATIKAPHKEKIIAFAGGTHINEAYELLQRVGGYEPVSHHEIAARGSAIGRGIGAPVANGYMAKPQPISVELLEHYLKN